MEYQGIEYRLIDFNNELRNSQLKLARKILAKTASKGQNAEQDVEKAFDIYDVELEFAALIYLPDGEQWNKDKYKKRLELFDEMPVSKMNDMREGVKDFYNFLLKSIQENSLVSLQMKKETS